MTNPVSSASVPTTITVTNTKTGTANARMTDKTSTKKTTEKATIRTSGKSAAELKKELEQLESEKGLNNKKMSKIEEEIKKLTKQVQENMQEAKELQEQAIEEHKEEANKVVEDNIAAYVMANKEGGNGMTKEELQANIANAMPDSPNLAKALAAFVVASKELSEIDTLLGSLNGIILDTKGIELDIKNKTTEYDKAVKSEEEGKESKKCCDPIGFMKDGARYDFIVDDGSFDSTSDFLGSDNNWAAMEALDSDGDKIINASELKDAGIKMVKTVNGEKKVVDIAEEFGEDFQVDLSSYQSGGSFDGISNADSDNDGTLDQELLGTYTIQIKDENIKGYNTLDDVDYLKSEYGLSNTASDSDMSAELKEHNNFFNDYSATAASLNAELKQGLISYGISEDTIDNITQQTKTIADKEANIFMQKMESEAKEEQKAEDAKKAEEAKKEEEAKKAEEEAKKKEEKKETQAAQAAASAGAATTQNASATKSAAEEESEKIKDSSARPR